MQLRRFDTLAGLLDASAHDRLLRALPNAIAVLGASSDDVDRAAALYLNDVLEHERVLSPGEFAKSIGRHASTGSRQFRAVLSRLADVLRAMVPGLDD